MKLKTIQNVGPHTTIPSKMENQLWFQITNTNHIRLMYVSVAWTGMNHSILWLEFKVDVKQKKPLSIGLVITQPLTSSLYFSFDHCRAPTFERKKNKDWKFEMSYHFEVVILNLRTRIHSAMMQSDALDKTLDQITKFAHNFSNIAKSSN